jgi:hypothetical protein
MPAVTDLRQTLLQRKESATSAVAVFFGQEQKLLHGEHGEQRENMEKKPAGKLASGKPAS